MSRFGLVVALLSMKASLCLVVAMALLGYSSSARACGGFFCGRQPVDQQAERVVFGLSDEGTTMIVQISYTGEADAFAWLLPLSEVPLEGSLETFPALALTALDVNTAPMFLRPEDPECNPILLNGGGPDSSTPGVTVHLEQTVGPFEAAVIEGDGAAVVLEWLEDNGFRVGAGLESLVEPYVEAGMKLLALKLSADSEVSDIEPIRFALPPGSPSIPIRLSSVAAEPEMGLLVFILADQRYGPANWAELEIDPATLVFGSHLWPVETSWLARVAQAADEVDGKGFVTEMAGPTGPLVEQARGAMPPGDDQRVAQEELVALLQSYPYLTRLYSRLSPDEMTLDPIFRRHAGGDVARERQMVRFVDGDDLCRGNVPTVCDVTTCGPRAACTPVYFPPRLSFVAGCDCPEGTVARLSADPTGARGVVCVQTASFLEPGPGENPCANVDCGSGSCEAVNMQPTCRCDDGSVAVGWVQEDEGRIRCVDPNEAYIPEPEPEPALDAGPTMTSRSGGCSCRAGGQSPMAPLAVLVALLFCWRSRIQ